MWLASHCGVWGMLPTQTDITRAKYYVCELQSKYIQKWLGKVAVGTKDSVCTSEEWVPWPL